MVAVKDTTNRGEGVEPLTGDNEHKPLRDVVTVLMAPEIRLLRNN